MPFHIENICNMCKQPNHAYGITCNPRQIHLLYGTLKFAFLFRLQNRQQRLPFIRVPLAAVRQGSHMTNIARTSLVSRLRPSPTRHDHHHPREHTRLIHNPSPFRSSRRRIIRNGLSALSNELHRPPARPRKPPTHAHAHTHGVALSSCRLLGKHIAADAPLRSPFGCPPIRLPSTMSDAQWEPLAEVHISGPKAGRRDGSAIFCLCSRVFIK